MRAASASNRGTSDLNTIQQEVLRSKSFQIRRLSNLDISSSNREPETSRPNIRFTTGSQCKEVPNGNEIFKIRNKREKLTLC